MTRCQHLVWIVALASLATWAFWVSEPQWLYEDVLWRAQGFEWRWEPRALTQASWYVLGKVAPGPTAARVANLALHGIVAVLVWHLARRLRLSSLGAYLAAGVVLLHPLTVETVAYAAQRGELFAAIGVVTACLVATGRWWQWPTALGIVAAVLFGVLGKESAVVALGLVPLTMWARGHYGE